MSEISDLTDDELASQAAQIEAERSRRAIVADAERRTDEACLAYLLAAGRRQGAAYESPLGIVGAYPRGWQVTHFGKRYRATAPGVTVAPPGAGWQATADDPIPFWEPGEYAKGARVQDAGRIWVASADVDGARPSEYPGGWDLQG